VYRHAAIFAVQIALSEMWKSFGVVPSTMLSHGLGEYALSVVSGVRSLASALTEVVEQARMLPALKGSIPSATQNKQALREAVAAGLTAVIEIGPGAQPQPFASELDCLWLVSMTGSEQAWPQLLESVAQLYLHGYDIDWIGFDKPYR